MGEQSERWREVERSSQTWREAIRGGEKQSEVEGAVRGGGEQSEEDGSDQRWRGVGSGPRCMICVTLFCTLHE